MSNKQSTFFANQRALFKSMHPTDKELQSPLHKTEVIDQLRGLGLPPLRLLQSEARYLPLIIYPDEVIGAVAYGRYPGGRAMLVATDRRVIFLDKKPMFTKSDEINYDVVAGVSYNQAGPTAMVNLHTRVGDYPLKTFNTKLARDFRDFIEVRCLNQTSDLRREQY